ncbi:hypothetical protein RHMOL_Rhmol06G0122100 [Rhododendron molle]|uniref:Uncharacterized protein n=2 Tax=Rhododendron molle TaxID=49168 RepID=A0ACC0NDH6_RHOML|nr:hypothetical protein RHMOL_Rhmol06G0122100 [Rhododendron molle]
MSRPRGINLNGKNYFLTYPQCNISITEALDQIINTTAPTNKKYIRVCRELHEDGQPHLHALVQYEGRFKLTNQHHFNLRSPTCSRQFHPNIQVARSSSHVKAYIEKGGDYEEWGTFQIDGRSGRGSPHSIAEVYAEALNAPSKSAALQIIKEKDPKSYVLQFHNINSNFDRIFAVPIPPYVNPYNPESFNRVPQLMVDWAQDNVTDIAARPDRPKSIIIEGPSRVGKTKWARSLGPHNYLSGHLDLNPRVYSNDAWYNVIDDIPPHYLFLKHWKQFIGAQQGWLTNCKYGRPVQIKGGIPTIVLCNPDVQSSFKFYLDKEDNSGLKEWTLLNSKFIILDGTPLYSTSPQSSESETTTQSVQDQEEAN